MANFRYIVERDFDLARYGPAFDRESLVSMSDVVKIVQASVELNTPRDQGIAQGRIKENVQLLQDAARGDVYSADDPAKINTMETGRGAGRGYPNIEDLRAWMQRKGIDAKKLFIVVRAINLKGITGKHVFKKSYESTQKDVERILGDLLPEKIIRSL